MAEKEATATKLISLIRTTALQAGNHSVDDVAESSAIADLGLDSLTLLEIVAEIEYAFKVRIPDETLVHFQTIADLSAFVHSRLRDQPLGESGSGGTAI